MREVMEVESVLHMNGSPTEDSSYANNSLLQRKVISMTIPLIKEAITKTYNNIISPTTSTSLVVADLGCSSGPNTFFVVSEIIKEVNMLSKTSGHEPPECKVYLNDLPSNDFNLIFRSLKDFLDKMKKDTDNDGIEMGSCYVFGAAGSFYGRLFPSNSLHFVHSNYSLQWLSQVPHGLEDNKGNVSLTSTSTQNVLKAYYEQFQRDFSIFLKCRSKELVPHGRMILTFVGRRGEYPADKEGLYVFEAISTALNEMASQGYIEEDNLNSFNIPVYTPCAAEVKAEIENEGSFSIDRLEVTEVNWNTYVEELKKDKLNYDFDVSKVMRAVLEPILVHNFGIAIMDKLFFRYREILNDPMLKKNVEFVNVTVSMTKYA